MTTFIEAMAETERMAKADGKLYYLYKNSGWQISAQYWNDWLFRAYPGGRKELSKRGVPILQETHCLCGREWAEMGYCFYCEKFKPTIRKKGR